LDGLVVQTLTSTTSEITLSHRKNSFSLAFAALSYFNPATNRYRYQLEGLDHEWNEVSSDRRVAAYTTLPCSPKVGKKFAKLTLHGTRCQFFVAPVAVTSRMRSSSLFLGRAAQPFRL